MDVRLSPRLRRVLVFVMLAGVGVALAYGLFALMLTVVTLD